MALASSQFKSIVEVFESEAGVAEREFNLIREETCTDAASTRLFEQTLNCRNGRGSGVLVNRNAGIFLTYVVQFHFSTLPFPWAAGTNLSLDKS